MAGDGGRVTVLSINETRMNGSIRATGGAQSGNGGLVEVSGGNLSLSGSVDTSAPFGNLGTILLDPTNLNIIGTAPGNIDNLPGEFVGSTLPFTAADGTPPPSTLSASKITSLGTTGVVIIQASGTISVQAPIRVDNGLTMQAGGSLTVGAPITSAGNILLQAGTSDPTGALVVNADVSAVVPVNGGPSLVKMIAGTGGIALNGNISGTTVDLNTTGAVTQTTATGISAFVLQSSNGVTGNVGLTGANTVAAIGDFAVSAGNFQLSTNSDVAVSGTLSTPRGNVFLQAATLGATISLGDTAAVNTSNAGFASFRGDNFQVAAGGTAGPGGVINAGTFELAPFSPGRTEVLGDLAGLVLTNINAGTVRIGAIASPSDPGPGATAAAIGIVGLFDATNRALELDATGLIDEQGDFGDGRPGSLKAATLSGNGGDWRLAGTNVTNVIDALGPITATSFTLSDLVNLTVAGVVNGGSVVTIDDAGLLTVNGTLAAVGGTLGPSIALTAGAIAIPGVLTDGGVGSTQLVATGGTFANAGTISETGTLIAGVLSGSAFGVVNLFGGGPSVNQVATLADPGIPSDVPTSRPFIASSFALRDGKALTVNGQVTSTGQNGRVFLSSTDPAGITISTTGNVTAQLGGTASFQTDSITNNGAVNANTAELAPFTAGSTVTLGAAGPGLSLVDTTNFNVVFMTIGAVTDPVTKASTTTAGGIAITGPFAFSGEVGPLTLDAASTTAPGATGAVTQTAPLTVAGVSGTADSYALTNPANSIGDVTNLTATRGDADIVSTQALFPDTVAAPAGNVFFSSSSPTGVILLGPVTALGRVGIEADFLGGDGGSIKANTFELAPFTQGTVVTLGFPAGGLSLTSLNGDPAISVNTVVAGAVTEPGNLFPTIRAGAVTIAGAFGDPAVALDLEASAATATGATGAISQSAPLTASTLGASGSSVILTDPGNQFSFSSGITASVGPTTPVNNFELVDGTNLTLNGNYSGNNLFIEVALKNGSLTVGGAGSAMLSSAAGGRISLVADSLDSTTASTIIIGITGNGAGMVELAPFSATNVSLGGGGAGMQITPAFLSGIDIQTGTLLVGGFTNVLTGATAPTISAASITLDGPVNLANRAGTLVLTANGSVTEPGGPLTVGTVTGAAVGDFSLNNAKNNIQASTGMTATGGNVVLVDDPTLLLTGPYTGTNLFFQVTQAGGSLQIGSGGTPATLMAAAGGRISLVADSIAETATSTLSAPGGTLEVAPFSAINESVLGTNGAGQLLVDSTLLSDITGGALATLVIGEYTTPRINTPTISAANVTVDGALSLTGTATTLGLFAIGAVSEPAGPINVGIVTGSAGTDFALDNKANAIGQAAAISVTNGNLSLIDGTSLVLTGSQSAANTFIEVASAGGGLSLGGTFVPDFLSTASGGRMSLVADNITTNGTSTISAPAGTLELAPFSAINTSLLGTAGGQLIVSQALLSSIAPGPGRAYGRRLHERPGRRHDVRAIRREHLRRCIRDDRYARDDAELRVHRRRHPVGADPKRRDTDRHDGHHDVDQSQQFGRGTGQLQRDERLRSEQCLEPAARRHAERRTRRDRHGRRHIDRNRSDQCRHAVRRRVRERLTDGNE
jgi:hypothetical protein